MSPARVKCPTCGRTIEWSSASPYRPFCSERCKLIDLGAWLAEQRAVAGDSAASEGEPPPEPPETV
ncbi:MAG TPA: DNA gyrase inhibitor YacG [Steroidobacteraceae bacterium]|nr:DNA gyrase inhibitor YacG [Steroidobacteraceae bacterium]